MSKVRPTSDNASYLPKYTKFIKPNFLNLFDGKSLATEEDLPSIKFKIHNFTNTDKNKYVFIFALVEFGCELFLPHYFLDILCKKYREYKIVVIGWAGRAFLYSKFVDEFWEIDDEYMWLRDYAKAFQHSSKNIRKLELCLKRRGVVFLSNKLGNMVLENECLDCNNIFGSETPAACSSCNSMNIKKSMFADLNKAKTQYKSLAYKDEDVSKWVTDNMPDKMFGIFARSRRTYGRNLDQAFYIDIIKFIKDMGYNPVWLGERQNVLPCPDSSVCDFTKMPQALDLRYTLEVVSRCACTFQCWTASTRLSQITNTPFVLVESVDQIYGKGHEGKRLSLFTQDFRKQKIILSNFHKSCEFMENFLFICKKCIRDFLIKKDSDVVIGLVDYPEYVEGMKEKANLWKTNLKKITLKDM